MVETDLKVVKSVYEKRVLSWYTVHALACLALKVVPSFWESFSSFPHFLFRAVLLSCVFRCRALFFAYFYCIFIT